MPIGYKPKKAMRPFKSKVMDKMVSTCDTAYGFGKKKYGKKKKG